ncbi:MAG TPA: response regulator, partial [Opitutaceae bacterium]|nr:response regulator [Opitutaceae bacterium]
MNDERKADVLLVDDEEQIRRLLRCTLEDDGYSVREAATGRIALGEIALQEPGFMILDLGLPDTSGIEVLRTLRLHCSAPVLILTVLGHEKNKIAALDAGADDYLVKPFRS